MGVISKDRTQMGGGSDVLGTYQEVMKECKDMLPCRVYLTPTWEDVESKAGKYKKCDLGPYLKMDRLKVFTDGALG